MKTYRNLCRSISAWAVALWIAIAAMSGAMPAQAAPIGLYVSSLSTNKVSLFNINTGAFISDVATTAGSSGLSQPNGITLGPDGNLYVDSFGNAKIKKFNPNTGAYISDFDS